MDLVDGILFLAPGFLALKLFYLFGAQRPRSQWEWTTWSVIASLPINGVAAVIALQMGPPALLMPDPLEIALRLVVASAFGISAALLWKWVRRAPYRWADMLRMAVTDSAWDQALEDADLAKRQVELILDDDSRYAGTIRYGGREDNAAEGWVYLIWPEVYDASIHKLRDAKGTHGILVHRDRIKRLRVLLTMAESAEREASTNPDLDEV